TRRPVRESDFSTRIKRVYDYRCAVCNTNTHSLLIAAHIRPVSESGTDKTNNGICLCRNHDSLYESGELLIDIDGNIKQDGKKTGKINFPKIKDDWPCQENLLYR